MGHFLLGFPQSKSYKPKAASGPPPLHILDHFTGADGTALASHAPDINTPGNAWEALAGTWTIQGNAAKKATNSSIDIAVIDSGISNATLKVVVTGSPITGGISARFTDATHGWLFVSNGTNLYIFEGPGWTQRASAAADYTSGDTMTVTLAGATVSVLFHAITASYALATQNQTATKHGLYAYNDAHISDDFEVTP